MARKPETTFYESVHRHLPHLKLLYREKMNNPYRGGTADWWFSGKHDLWIEYKFLPRVPQKGSVWLCKPDVKSPDLSRLQQIWLHDRHVEGRNVGVIVGCPAGGVVLRDLEWEKEIPVELFRERIWPRDRLAYWIKQEVQGT